MWTEARPGLPAALAALALLAAAAPAATEGGWTRLTTPEIADALVARTIAFDNGATQEFRADGTTTYDSGSGPSAGKWRASDDEYCSIWPPSEDWVCFDVERSADGLDLRFTSTGGGFSVGRYIDLR
ncbi:MAG: hypothetical protein N2422_00365 [Rhodobacteraceae bacterium]|nr:hypothetical protein [Paracoccaceae bacterium]